MVSPRKIKLPPGRNKQRKIKVKENYEKIVDSAEQKAKDAMKSNAELGVLDSLKQGVKDATRMGEQRREAAIQPRMAPPKSAKELNR